MNGKPYEIKRLPCYSRLERGDVIVFNYPYSDKNDDSIAMNLSLYYCKRTVGIPGDTLEIIDGFYRVRGYQDTLGVATEQENLRGYISDHALKEPDISRWQSWMRFHP